MIDSKPDEPLSSAELQQDRDRAGTDPMAGAEEAGGASRPASEQGISDEDGQSARRPNPIAGTMLPPD
jgi:hypothetical protein